MGIRWNSVEVRDYEDNVLFRAGDEEWTAVCTRCGETLQWEEVSEHKHADDLPPR